MKNWKLSDFNYDLPKEYIAQTPLKDRSSSKLMILNREKNEITHKHFSDIIDLLDPKDCLVLNDTKVIPARLLGVKEETGAHIEVFLLKRSTEENVWECMVRPGKRVKKGTIVIFGNGELKAEIRDSLDDGLKTVKFIYEGIFEEVLDKLGQMPLPPYITEKLEDKDRYQTVYSKNPGSAAAPTAGLHFTNELLEKIKSKGIRIAYVTLHVGLGTFRPVKVENITDHKMHSEFYIISKEACDIINETKKNGGRVISVGTTSTRTLESAADEKGYLIPKSEDTDIFIYPGYKFKIIDGLITNFHLPESTLLMLISAFYNREEILKAYESAKENNYRFFSFGDAMFIF